MSHSSKSTRLSLYTNCDSLQSKPYLQVETIIKKLTTYFSLKHFLILSSDRPPRTPELSFLQQALFIHFSFARLRTA
jgi:hypothetical protein